MGAQEVSSLRPLRLSRTGPRDRIVPDADLEIGATALVADLGIDAAGRWEPGGVVVGEQRR